MAKILVIDDEAPFRESLVELLGDLSHEAKGVGGQEEASRAFESERFDLVFVDFQMPGANGVATIKSLGESLGAHSPPMIMLTAFSDSKNTIEAMRAGAFDHLTKPVSKGDIEAVIASALKAFPPSTPASFANDANATSTTRKPLVGQSPQLIGHSASLREVLKMIGRLAASESTVLITGETGTGKEVVARAIHENSERASCAFVAVNCAAVPENLLESELFGHVRGAFTGATHDRRGSFQLVEGGTLFLDEIGDMEISLQAKILRAVQEREVVPVGASRPVKVDCRILAATHQDLTKMVERKQFREDLFYRLNVVQLHLPALRERVSDIEPLTEYFLKQAGASGVHLSEAALTKLREHSWPGNIRELKNVIDRAVVLSRGRLISEDNVRLISKTDATTSPEVADVTWHEAIGQLERKLLSHALERAHGNRSEAARRLGIQRQLLYAKIKEHQLEELH